MIRVFTPCLLNRLIRLLSYVRVSPVREKNYHLLGVLARLEVASRRR